MQCSSLGNLWQNQLKIPCLVTQQAPKMLLTAAPRELGQCSCQLSWMSSLCFALSFRHVKLSANRVSSCAAAICGPTAAGNAMLWPHMLPQKVKHSAVSEACIKTNFQSRVQTVILVFFLSKNGTYSSYASVWCQCSTLKIRNVKLARCT